MKLELIKSSTRSDGTIHRVYLNRRERVAYVQTFDKMGALIRQDHKLEGKEIPADWLEVNK